MSLLKEFSDLKLEFSDKMAIAGVVSCMPFWYLAIFLFSKISLEKNFHIPTIIAICLSIWWWVINLGIADALDAGNRAELDIEETHDLSNGTISISIIISWISISIAIAMCYWSNCKSLHLFIYDSFGLVAFIFIIMYGMSKIAKKNKNVRQNKAK